MTVLFLLALQTAPAAAVSAEEPQALVLLEKARDAWRRVDQSVVSYTALVQERVSVGIRTLLKDRTVFQREGAARVRWSRDGPTVVRVLGAREQNPSRTYVPRAWSGLTADEFFDPAADRMLLGLGDPDDKGDWGDEDDGGTGDVEFYLRHPLADDAEEFYRFSLGDTLTIGLPDGERVRAIQLQVIPRQRSIHLLSGSLWIDERSGSLVRGVYRLAKDIDVLEDFELDEDDGPNRVPGFLKPIEVKVGIIAVDYSLWGGDHWLPRGMRLEGSARAGMITAPASLELSYRIEDVVLEREVSDDWSEEAAADSAILRWSEPGDRRRMSLQDGRQVEVIQPRDSERLLNSPELGDAAGRFLDDRDISEFRRMLADIPEAPQVGRPWSFEWGIRGPGLVRFNRVEGLSVGARYQTRLGRFDLRTTGRMGYGDLTPNVDVRLTRETPLRTWSLATYTGLASVDVDQDALKFGNSASGLFLGRDDGEYSRASGVAFTLGPAPTDRPTWSVSLYGEAQRTVFRETTESLGSLVGGPSLRPVIRATAGEQAGAQVRLKPWWGTDPNRAQAGLDLLVQGEIGTHALARASATASGAVPLPGSLRVAASVQGAILRGDRVRQRQWYLGGTSTLRGYRGSAMSGSEMLRGRLELARTFSFGGVVLFGDGGWAGEDTPSLNRALFSAGAGFSVLDGLVRLDLARALRNPTGWSLELYLDAIL